jgi:hypothetical protein
MSRSYKKAIYKDRGHLKKLYWRIIRSNWKNKIRSNVFDLPNEKSIINDYNYRDYMYIFSKTSDQEYKKYTRK